MRAIDPGRTVAAGAALALCCALFALGPTGAQAGEFERTFNYSAEELAVTSLVGSVRVEPSTSKDMEVTVRVRGRDADEKWIQFDSKPGPQSRLVVRFPLDEHRRYVYPAAEGRSSITLDSHGEHGDWLGDLLRMATAEKVEVRGKPWSDALELWTEIVVRVPASREAQVRLGIGSIEVANVEGRIDVGVKAGPVRAQGVQGELRVDTGSGAVDVSRIDGELTIDTGSGSVRAEKVTSGSDVSIDTGSGGVDVQAVRAAALRVDTGSGGVDLVDVDVKELVVDTGSGSVEADEIGADDVKIDTGSGGVRLELVRMGKGGFDVDTGSGGIRMAVPAGASATFDVETGSGSITEDLEGIELSAKQRHEARFAIGGGAARVTLSTGSGSVRLAHSGSAAAR